VGGRSGGSGKGDGLKMGSGLGDAKGLELSGGAVTKVRFSQSFPSIWDSDD
jgi:hypothetical protein